MSLALATALAAACAASVVAVALGFGLRRASSRLARAEAELEAERDATWEAHELSERARLDAERAIRDAEARAEAGARAKSKFLATVTHEMRTPLSGVIGTTDLLLDTRLAPDQRTYARAVKQSAEAMLSLVDEILDLSRIDAGGLTLQDAPFDVADLVEGVAELLAPRAQARGLDLAVSVGLDTPDQLLGDPARIRQILLNLAGNAIKFTQAGGVGLRVEAGAEIMRISVLDTGPGFEMAEAERLFGEFEQSEAEGAAAGGVGLGLAISRRLAEAMGGGLAAEAAPGAGATFTLTLPLRRTAAAREPAHLAKPLQGRRILVVSAAPFGGPWLVERLAQWGAATSLAGPDADLPVRAAAADTVLIDRAVAARVADLSAAARRGGASRVLLLLSPSERSELPTLAADGFDGYLVKPIRSGSLVSRLEDPRAGQAADEAVVRDVSTGAAFPAPGRLRVLLAEDDPVSALIALSHLGRLGHSAVHVADGRAACAAFAEQTFDAALIDLRMPALDGCAAARRLREIEAAEGRKPAVIVAVTANGGADDRAAALAAGMDGLLPKPLDRKSLDALLAPLVRRTERVA